MTLKEIIAEVGALKFFIGVIVLATLSLNGMVQFLKDAPAIVNSNTARLGAVEVEVSQHHDSILDNSDALAAYQAHTLADDTVNAAQAQAIVQLVQGQDYLICLRQERAAELDSILFTRDCGLELINR